MFARMSCRTVGHVEHPGGDVATANGRKQTVRRHGSRLACRRPAREGDRSNGQRTYAGFRQLAFGSCQITIGGSDAPASDHSANQGSRLANAVRHATGADPDEASQRGGRRRPRDSSGYGLNEVRRGQQPGPGEDRRASQAETRDRHVVTRQQGLEKTSLEHRALLDANGCGAGPCGFRPGDGRDGMSASGREARHPPTTPSGRT